VRKFFSFSFVVTLVVCGGVASSIDVVEAHAGLKSSEPPASSVLEQSPKEIVLNFGEAVEASFGSIRLFDSNSQSVALPTPKFVEANGAIDAKTIQVEIPELQSGSYLVVWRVVSADSHPVQGAFAFQIGTKGLNLESLSEEILASSSAPFAVRLTMGFARWLSFLGVMVMVGAMLLATRIVGFSRVDKIIFGSWITAFVGSTLVLLLQAPYALGQAMSVGEVFNAADDVLQTRLGTWLVVRGTILLAFLILIRQRNLHDKSIYRMAAILLGIGLFATFSISGHPGMREFSALSIGTDIVHFLSVSAWMGGLVTLVLLGRKWQSESSLVISWFSFTATISMPIMVATGVAQAWRMMEGFQNILSTTYGIVLSVKVLLVVVAIAAGTRARQVFKSKKVDQQDLRKIKFSRTVLAESMIGIAVLAVTAVLVSVPPLSVSGAAAFETSVVQANVIADIRVTPARVGEVEVHILLSPPGGSLQSITEATARISLVAEEIPAIPIEVQLVGTNHFQAALLVPRAGDWLLEIFVNSEPGKSLRFSTVVAIND
jgi:copper transport protein